MLEYSREVGKTDMHDQIRWIEVESLDQLEPLKFFYNQVSPDVYLGKPKIDENCLKNLRTPLESFHEFMRTILQSVVPNTTEHLKLVSKRTTSYEEIVELIMVSMALVVCPSKFQDYRNSVVNLRQFLKTEHGMSPKWPGVNRLQELRSCLRAYGEEENETQPGKMARDMENIIKGWD